MPWSQGGSHPCPWRWTWKPTLCTEGSLWSEALPVKCVWWPNWFVAVIINAYKLMRYDVDIIIIPRNGLGICQTALVNNLSPRNCHAMVLGAKLGLWTTLHYRNIAPFYSETQSLISGELNLWSMQIFSRRLNLHPSRQQKAPLWESPLALKIQQEVLENWDRYWAQATSVDIEVRNDWFVVTRSILIQPTE